MFLSAMAKSFPLLPWAKFSRSEAALFPGVSDHPAIGQRLAKGFFVNVSLLRFFPSDQLILGLAAGGVSLAQWQFLLTSGAPYR